MKKILVVVDMQNDFIDGALGTAEAVSIVPYVKEVIECFDGKVFFTRDTHFSDYMDTLEGKNLPVPHCVFETEGWEIIPELQKFAEGREIINKPTFGSPMLGNALRDLSGGIQRCFQVGRSAFIVDQRCSGRSSRSRNGAE